MGRVSSGSPSRRRLRVRKRARRRREPPRRLLRLPQARWDPRPHPPPPCQRARGLRASMARTPRPGGASRPGWTCNARQWMAGSRATTGCFAIRGRYPPAANLYRRGQAVGSRDAARVPVRGNAGGGARGDPSSTVWKLTETLRVVPQQGQEAAHRGRSPPACLPRTSGTLGLAGRHGQRPSPSARPGPRRSPDRKSGRNALHDAARGPRWMLLPTLPTPCPRGHKSDEPAEFQPVHGGGAGNRTRVRKRLAPASTCVADVLYRPGLRPSAGSLQR